jgi:CheY-like chemotaxis protein
VIALISHHRPLEILVVDDVPDIRLMLRASLQHFEGIGRVIEASGGTEALAKAVQLRPDAVVLDYVMPGVDGIETARRIKTSLPTTKIILFSAFLSDEVFEEAAEAGIDLCLSKFTTPDVVVNMIKNLCA